MKLRILLNDWRNRRTLAAWKKMVKNETPDQRRLRLNREVERQTRFREGDQ